MDLEIIHSNEHYYFLGENIGYLHFSFAEHIDINKMNMGPLRVFNEYLLNSNVTDLGYGSVRDIESIIYMIDGKLSYKNDKGYQENLDAGDLFLFSSGIGTISSMQIVTKPVRLLEIWVFPSKYSLKPSFMKQNFAKEEYTNKILQIVISEKKENKYALKIHQDANFYLTRLDSGREINYTSGPERKIYLFIIKGRILINNSHFFKRDAAKITFSSSENILLKNCGLESSEIIIIDVDKNG